MPKATSVFVNTFSNYSMLCLEISKTTNLKATIDIVTRLNLFTPMHHSHLTHPLYAFNMTFIKVNSVFIGYQHIRTATQDFLLFGVPQPSSVNIAIPSNNLDKLSDELINLRIVMNIFNFLTHHITPMK